jgi:hypothetical protein
MTNKNIALRLICIILISIVWIFFIPGLVAFKNNVFYSWMFKDKISDSLIISRVKNSGSTTSFYPKDTKEAPIKKVKITFSGFADHALNFIWLNSYIILGVFLFIIYPIYLRQCFKWKTLFLGIGVLLLFHMPNWFRNSELGNMGRTIYSYVNYDIDKQSFWLQELRGYLFSILLASFWAIGEIQLRRITAKVNSIDKDVSFDSLALLAFRVKRSFYQWQRDILLVLILFLPWTWFYWENITQHGDTRYMFAALVFHSFWIITIAIISSPFLMSRYIFWKLKTKLILSFANQSSTENNITLIKEIEPYPKEQLFLSSIATVITLVSPLLQGFFK